mmetsp:Transcript_64931/g.104914  ORF Transcript_64931/g.104914 Transcript_64931/m.104914 type:complete len:209 (-) Transcript_64931:166-792(-)
MLLHGRLVSFATMSKEHKVVQGWCGDFHGQEHCRIEGKHAPTTNNHPCRNKDYVVNYEVGSCQTMHQRNAEVGKGEGRKCETCQCYALEDHAPPFYIIQLHAWIRWTAAQVPRVSKSGAAWSCQKRDARRHCQHCDEGRVDTTNQVASAPILVVFVRLRARRHPSHPTVRSGAQSIEKASPKCCPASERQDERAYAFDRRSTDLRKGS